MAKPVGPELITHDFITKAYKLLDSYKKYDNKVSGMSFLLMDGEHRIVLLDDCALALASIYAKSDDEFKSMTYEHVDVTGICDLLSSYVEILFETNYWD